MKSTLTVSATAEHWEPMESFPRDGTPCDVLCETTDGKNGVTVIANDIKWARRPIGDEYTYVGSNNILSPYLVPLGWRPHRKLNEVPIANGETVEVRRVTLP